MEDKQVSTKQFAAVLFLLALAIKMFMLPALMLRIVGKDSIFVMLVWIAAEYVNLGLVLFVAVRNPDKSYFNILEECMGRVVSRVVAGVLALFALAKAVLIISEIKMFFSITMFDEINWAVMMVPLLVLLAAFSLRSLRAMGRTAEIFAPVILACTVILAFLLLDDMRADDLLPLLEDGFSPVASGILKFPMWFGDVTFLLLFLGKIKISRGFVVASLAAKTLASVAVLLFSGTLFATYANIPTLIDYGHNISNMTQFSLGSQDYGRFDLVFYCVWLTCVFLKLATVFCFFTRSVGFVAAKNSRYTITVISAAVLYVLGQFVLKSENAVFTVMTGPMKYALVPPALLMPLALAVCCLIKYKPNRHKPEKRGAQPASGADENSMAADKAGEGACPPVDPGQDLPPETPSELNAGNKRSTAVKPKTKSSAQATGTIQSVQATGKTYTIKPDREMGTIQTIQSVQATQPIQAGQSAQPIQTIQTTEECNQFKQFERCEQSSRRGSREPFGRGSKLSTERGGGKVEVQDA